jgi:AbrB family looped-hinge helix DNA binding protein
MDSIRASSKGQVVIPKPIREALGIRSGTELVFELVSDTGFAVKLKLKLNHREQVRRLAGSLAGYGRGRRASARTDDAAIAKAVREDDARIKRESRGREGG